MIERRFPYVAAWVRHHGRLEVGYHEFSVSFIRAHDPGGTVWEGASDYPTLDDAFAAADEGLAGWLRRMGIPRIP